MNNNWSEISQFLTSAGWNGADIQAIAGDMSSRRYYRLVKSTRTSVLMVADTTMEPFLRMTDWLAEARLSVPKILDERAKDGLLILEDFGATDLKTALLDYPAMQGEFYSDCISLLLRIRATEPPDLPRPDAAALLDWTRLADQHYPGVRPGRLVRFRSTLLDLLNTALSHAPSVSLRDFHTENMMWLPARTGYLRLGLLDYQDAFLTHPAYDLMSLLTDARTWIPRQLRSEVLAQYLENSKDEAEEFGMAFAALSAQRNLRILGIFARAGKHLEHMPRTHRYFCEALEHPAFERVRDETLSAVPPPDPER